MIKLMGWADVVYIPRIWYSAIPFAKSHKKPVIVHLHDYAPICPLSSIYDASKNTLCENKFPLCSMKCIYVSEKKRGRNVLELLSSVALNSTLAHTLGMSVVLSDAIICVSNRQRDLISERFSLLKPKISVVYNPIAELPETKATGDDFGYFGGSLLSKGIQILYKAAASLDHNKLKLRIHATNFGKLSDDTIHSFKKVGIIPYRRLVSSPLDRLYDKLRAVIIPSIAPETFSYVACEAALRGKLVIASKIGAIPEFLNGSSGAFFFDSQNHLQLAERLVYVNGLRREIAVDLGSKNREILSRRLNNKTTIERFIRVCEKVSK